MSGSQQVLFFKQWSSYLKRGELKHADIVLRRTPASPCELAFLLEVASQLCMLKKLRISNSSEIARCGASTLDSFIAISQHILTKDYLRKLISIHAKTNMCSPTHQLSSILIAVLKDCNGIQIKTSNQQSYKCLKNAGRLYYLLSNQTNSKPDAILQDIKERWTTRKLIGQDWRQSLVNLLIIWSANQMKKQQMCDEEMQIENCVDELLGSWIDGVSFLLVNCFGIRQFTEEDLGSISKQAKNMAKCLKLKSYRNKKQLLLQIKKKILERYKQFSEEPVKYVIFGYYFTIMHAFCSEADEQLQKIISIQDLIKNQTLLYKCFWGLSVMDQIKYFTAFSSFMRTVSQYNILTIYQKINCNVALTNSLSDLTPQSIISLVQNRNRIVFQQFNVQPITSSKVLLQYYLRISGVPLPKNQRNYASKRQRQTTVTPPVADPLHFMMISKKYWQDSFHRDVLQMALWMSLDSYCKWTQRYSFRDVSDKDVQQYLKKLNITVSVFFFSLQHPTRLLQYQPVECDCLRQLFAQPIFPSLVLNCKYFFHGYDWKTRNMTPKIDNGIENWNLPWAHLLINPKTMANFIYFEKGYELAHKLATLNRSNFDRVFGDFFNTRILLELQGLGISLANGEGEAKQKINFIDPQRKKYMILLLKESEKGSQKISHTARRLLQILI